MIPPSLPIPTPDLVRRAAIQFDQDPSSGPSDRVLHRVFSHHPSNVDLEDVLIKVVLLNGLYATNVYAMTAMAEHILGLGVDSHLASASVDLVDKIAFLTVRGKRRRHYSFATKYCSWHRPDQYPIYDSLVDKLLWAYSVQDRFAAFSRGDLLDYAKYKSIAVAFRDRYRLGDFSFKEVDKFLWYTARHLEM